MDENPLARSKLTQNQWSSVGFILFITVTRLYLLWLEDTGLRETAALFIGLPSLMAIGLTLLPAARSETGKILKGITIALCLSGILLAEGLICILMASPIFFLIGIIVGAVMDRSERQKRPKNYLLLLPLLLMSVEGTHQALTFDRQNTVIVVQTIDLSAAEVKTRLANGPNFNHQLPLFLQAGFPRPVQGWSDGILPGDVQQVDFELWNRPAGSTEFFVKESSNYHVLFEAVHDTTAIGQWLTWESTSITWHPINENQTMIFWEVQFQRNLDPAWYFQPLQLYGVRQSTLALSAAYFE